MHVGNYFLDKLIELQQRYPLIGDVRGKGLFIGIELVLDRETKVPAVKKANYIVERMKDHKILLSVDGIHHNVLKIKPPLVFTKENVNLFGKTLEKILQEDFVLL